MRLNFGVLFNLLPFLCVMLVLMTHYISLSDYRMCNPRLGHTIGHKPRWDVE